MPPPPPPPPPRLRPTDVEKGELSVKTPRPDISIGLRTAAIIDILKAQALTQDEAQDFLDLLEETHGPNGDEPLLCSVPIQSSGDIRFPFLVVEGKAYATGSPIFDAQNQAAVSGACGLKILHDLDDLASKARPGSHAQGLHVVFSICTEGPTHELWAHYMTTEDSVRHYNMVLLKTCNAILHDEFLRFLIAVDEVMSWAIGGFLDGIKKQLGVVAKAARATATDS